MRDSGFAAVAFGREVCDAGDLARHRHDCGYMTLVLSGGYVEAGDAGRFRVREGDVLIHRPFEAHRDLFAQRPAHVLNLPLPRAAPADGLVRLADPDAVARLAQSDLAAAASLACTMVESVATQQDWPDLLAAELREATPVAIGAWARRHGLAPATVSRGFAQVFGTTAARYRAEARARLAWHAVCASERPLVDLALEYGFADQAHMTRSLSALTGRTPGGWRAARQIRSRPGPSPRLA